MNPFIQALALFDEGKEEEGLCVAIRAHHADRKAKFTPEWLKFALDARVKEWFFAPEDSFKDIRLNELLKELSS